MKANAFETAQNFALVAQQYFSIVRSAEDVEGTEFLLQIYRALPTLVFGAMALPVVQLPDDDEQSERPSGRMARGGKTRHRCFGSAPLPTVRVIDVDIHGEKSRQPMAK
jgi:hypothetical protein